MDLIEDKKIVLECQWVTAEYLSQNFTFFYSYLRVPAWHSPSILHVLSTDFSTRNSCSSQGHVPN